MYLCLHAVINPTSSQPTRLSLLPCLIYFTLLYFTTFLHYPLFLQVRIFVPDASVPGMNMRDVFPGQPSFASLEGPCANVFRALDKLKEAHVLSVEIEKQTQKLMVLQHQQQQLQQMALEEVLT